MLDHVVCFIKMVIPESYLLLNGAGTGMQIPTV